MGHKPFLIFLLIVFPSNLSTASAHVQRSRSGRYTASLDLFSFLGGDTFAGGEICGLPVSGVGSLTAVAGPGVELRFRPVFVGATAGFCGNEGIPQIHTFDSEITHRGTFSYYSFFAGLIIKNYRLEVGELHGDNALWVTMTPKVDYSTAFAGISRRWGHVAFFEPGIKNVLPVVAHSVMATPVSGGYDFSPITVHYRLRDLFFAFSLKLGIGFN